MLEDLINEPDGQLAQVGAPVGAAPEPYDAPQASDLVDNQPQEPQEPSQASSGPAYLWVGIYFP